MTTFEKIQKAALARLDAGESIDHILQDYADYEEELRPILEEASGLPLGALLNRRPTYEKAKPKREVSTNHTSMWIMLAAAMAVLLIAGFGAILLVLPMNSDSDSAIAISQIVPDNCSLQAMQPTMQFSVRQQESQNSGRTYSTESDGVEAEAPVMYLGGGDAVGAPVDASSDSTGGSGGSTTDGYVEPLVAMPTAAAYSTAEMPSSVVREESETSSGLITDSIARGGVAPQIATEPLRAGEIDDNVDWDDYQTYRANYLSQYGDYAVRDVDVTDRQVIQVIDREGHPVMGACVQIYRGEQFVTASRTYATGMTLFFPNVRKETAYADSFNVVVSYGDVVSEATLNPESISDMLSVQLDIVQNMPPRLDVMFLLDATGSMGDEIAQLQTNILNISSQIDALPDNVDVRYGLVSYRDRGDDYVTRVWDFTQDVQTFQSQLATVGAGGGGDYPESLNEGLYMALNEVSWRGEDTIKLVFLVADAPPHVDYSNDADYSLLMQDALARGIKIHPIASSGLQPEGEFILRQIGQATMGHFIFLTYDEGNPGTAGDDRPDLHVGTAEDEQGVGDYSVGQLDEVVMRLISDELALLSD